MTFRTISSSLVATLALAWAASPALAKDDATSGLAVGTVVPSFMLPVVNDWEDQRRWGPNRWVGKDPKAPKKLVVMSFFATYCEPCKKEMPELVRLYEKYGAEGLGVMLVSIDKGKDSDGKPNRDKVIELAKQNAVNFPVTHDRFQVVARRYEAERLPYMLMVGPDGVVQRVHVGYTEEMKAGLENEIRELLGLDPLPKVAEDKPKEEKKSKRKKRTRKKRKTKGN